VQLGRAVKKFTTTRLGVFMATPKMEKIVVEKCGKRWKSFNKAGTKPEKRGQGPDPEDFKVSQELSQQECRAACCSTVCCAFFLGRSGSRQLWTQVAGHHCGVLFDKHLGHLVAFSWHFGLIRLNET
jgi:hypothetical protein